MSTLVPKTFLLAALIVASALLGHRVMAQPGEALSAIKLSSGRVRANGITIAYESFGPADRETVLLISGTGAQLTGWPIELCEELVKRGYRVIRYDNRDVGPSTKLEAAGSPDWAAIDRALKAGKPAPLAYTCDDMAKDAVGLLDALGIKKAHVVGASQGGMIAQLVAINHPEHTLSFTSIMAGSGNPAVPMKLEILAKIPPPAPEGDQEAVIAREVKIMQMLGSPDYPTDEKTLRERIIRDMKRSPSDPAGLARHQAAAIVASSDDRRTSLKAIKVPTVVLHGANDPLVPVEGGREVAASIPGAELRNIPGMGHDLPIAFTKTVADAITAAASRATGAKAAK